MTDERLEKDFGRPMLEHFLFAPTYKNFNHGSFGTYPASVHTDLQRFQALAEASPDPFLRYVAPSLLDVSRRAIADTLHAPAAECVFVQNATLGVNTVLRNLVYQPGDVIIYFDTIYGSCEKTLVSIMETNSNLQVRKVDYTLPCSHGEIVQSFLQVIERTQAEGLNPKLAIFDTVVSLPGVRFPFERLTAVCAAHGILSLVDGAHGVGHIPLDLHTLNADFFVSNCHKWLYTPRGCCVLHVPRRNQHYIRTTFPTSHGYVPPLHSALEIRNPLPPSTPDPAADFAALFAHVGTIDLTPYLCVPAALKFRHDVCGGEAKVMAYCKRIGQRGADVLARRLGMAVMDDGVAWEGHGGGDGGGGLRDTPLATVGLPIGIAATTSSSSSYSDDDDESPRPNQPVAVAAADAPALQAYLEATLVAQYHTFVPVFTYRGRFWCRVCGQVYLEERDFEWLADVLLELLGRVRSGAWKTSKLRQPGGGGGEQEEEEEKERAKL